MFSKFLKTTAAAAAIIAMPVSAVAATPAASLSVADRVGATLQDESAQLEGVSEYIVPIVIVVALGLGLYFALEDDNDAVSA